MKTPSSIVTLVLAILTLFSIASCMKAQHDYTAYINYHKSSAGYVEDFARGFRGGSQGDFFGPILDHVSEKRRLAESVSSGRFWGWIFLIATGVSFAVFLRAARTPPKPASNTASQAAPADFKHIISCERCGQQLRVPSGKGRLLVRCPSCTHSFPYYSL
jgi:hypothetical protein